MVLGHFIFVYINPTSTATVAWVASIMNAMLASGGYPWTVIPVEKRADYLSALEAASVEGDVAPFSKFLAQRVGAKVKPVEAG